MTYQEKAELYTDSWFNNDAIDPFISNDDLEVQESMLKMCAEYEEMCCLESEDEEDFPF